MIDIVPDDHFCAGLKAKLVIEMLQLHFRRVFRL